ncbi:Ger(x)C family spore germination protein [Cohnella endophytica]|uniref:Ger(X)C family spore germination protein n=1 Tax=Cohnella endophytica TaxID=2419778 RepID=A0A494YDF4_9BACL|nr:Ger(x)C family spore germination protein [Cohnella endophytica]RKP58045.1 Ger(x)C family spore germination protein [Cohnella endophytica]
MSYRLLRILVAVSALFVLPGCWNSKDIQNMAYVTAVGLDYDDGNFITYIQVLNFSNVGRSENIEVGKTVPVWIGRGVGKTISESFSSIYSTSQMRVFWGHVKAIVCSENMLKRGVREAFDAVNRYRELRYNLYIYGTNEKLSDIFVQKSIFNLSPLDTLMFTPEQIYAQRSSILSVTGNRFFSEINEPGEPGMLPSLAINKEVWKEDTKDKPMLQINGAYFFQATKMAAWLSEDELAGARWTQTKLKRCLIHVPLSGKPIAAIVLNRPRYSVKVRFDKDEVKYDLKVRISGYLDELLQDIPITDLETMAEDVVRNQISDSFDNGLAKKVDVLQLEEHLYRDHPKRWHALHQTQNLSLKPGCIRNIDVKINIVNTGKYKEKQE